MAEADLIKRTGPDAELATALDNLEALAPTLAGHANRSVRNRLNSLQRILVTRAVETYEPEDRDGFAVVVEELATQVPDLTTLSTMFGVSVSTLYRWKSGDAVPHRLVRTAIKDHVLRILNAPAGHGGLGHMHGQVAN